MSDKEESSAEATSAEAPSSKRKRSESSDNSEPDEGEFELYTKYYSTIKKKNRNVNVIQESQENNEKPPTRKRKFVFKTDDFAAKRSRKFYYLGQYMTKPRRPRIGQKLPETAMSDSEATESVFRKPKLHFTKVDPKSGALCLMHRRHLKSDLFYNDEKQNNFEILKKQDLIWNVVDEIALEGLDGITVEAFWKRLQLAFPNVYNRTVCDRIWRMICNNKRINFCILSEPRDKLVVFDLQNCRDPDSGSFMEPLTETKEIYPISPVSSKEVQGSCATFDSRKENNGVRKFSMEKAQKLYGHKLVLVADQAMRNKAIVSEETDPNIELLGTEYCLLERIARSRDQGEVTLGKMSLTTVYPDIKHLNHHLKCLTQNFLIVPQPFHLKSPTSLQTMTGALIQLSRFYSKKKTKQVIMMEQIANILKDKPGYCISLDEFRNIFGRHRNFVKLFKLADFRKFFEISDVNYRQIYPNAPKNEYMSKNGSKEKQLKLLRMIDPTANVTALLEIKESKEVQVEPEGDSPGHKFINYDYLHEIFLYILSSGKDGVTIQEIHDYFKMDFYSARMGVRKLLLRNVTDSHKVDLGRQQSLKFFAKCLVMPGLQINTEPKKCQLSPEAKSKVLQAYDQKFDSNPNYYTPPEDLGDELELLTINEHTLHFSKFSCPIFLTEILTDPIPEERTMMEIVLMGRDRLLLAGSNLEVSYESEFKDFLLKRDNFSKLVQLFLTGFGQIIYEFLANIRISTNIKADNKIIFSAAKLASDFNRSVILDNSEKVLHIKCNMVNPHSDKYYIDQASKCYLFEAMLNENHVSTQPHSKLREVFERSMKCSGKKLRSKERLTLLPIKKFEHKEQSDTPDTMTSKKFMGPNPVLEFCDESEEGVKTEIYTSTAPKEFVESRVYIPKDTVVTQRYIDRANTILQIVHDKTIVQNIISILKEIRSKEVGEGYDKMVCKKSIISILARLVEEGYVRIIDILMTGKNVTRTETFVCLPHLEIDHPFIKSTIDQLKLKFFVSTVKSTKTLDVKKKKIESPFLISNVKDSITELKQLTSSKTEISYTFNPSSGRTYGYKPKFAKMKVLHEFLFYIIRELNSDSKEVDRRQISELIKNLKFKMSSDDFNNLPPAYAEEISWKTFIRPLSDCSSYWPKGWALACDITLRMPLSVFVQVYSVNYVIPELNDYLTHPIKKHYLLKHIPINIRNALLYKRKYFFAIYETLTNLCYAGLLQLGPRNFKDKDQIFIYLNSKASLYDTCTSKPGYNQIEDKKYKKLSFTFNTGSDVEVYWSELWRISMNTQLGKRKVLDGQYVTIENLSSKPSMIATLKAKTFQQGFEEDTGRIPGDKRGAAGLDSSLWVFFKRNWLWGNRIETSAKSAKNIHNPGIKHDNFNSALIRPIKFDMLAQKDRKVYLKKPLKSAASKKSKKSKLKVFRRKIRSAYRPRVREYYDAVDKSIMKKNQQCRVDWNDEEDQILRFCRAATVFLCPVSKKQSIPYNIIRDVLHKLNPASKNKTARAIQRRIYILLMTDEIIRIMETNVENFLNSETIAKYFEQVHSRYKNNVKVSDSQIFIAFIYLMGYIHRHKKEMELLLLGYIATVDFFSDPYLPLFELVLQNAEDENAYPMYSDPKTEEDIVKDTIKTVVHCSMSCKSNCPEWVFQLFHIYKKFPDDLIRATVTDLKKSQFIVVNKGREEKTAADNWHTPLKLSHVYNTLMKSSTFTVAVLYQSFKKFVLLIKENLQFTASDGNFIAYNELSSFWPKFSLTFEIPEMGILLNPDIEDHGEVVEELANRFLIYLKRIFEGTNESSNKKDEVVILEEKADDKKQLSEPTKNLEDIKTDVRRLIFSVPYLCEDRLEEYYKNLLDSSTIEDINKYINLMIDNLKQFAFDNLSGLNEDLKNFVTKIDNEESIEDHENSLKYLSKLVFAIQNIQQLMICPTNEETSLSLGYEEKFKKWELESLYEYYCGTNNDESRNYKSKKSRFGKNYNNGMEQCFKRAKDGDFPSLEEIKEGIMNNETGENRNFPHITDLITLLTEGRFPELDNDYETIERMRDHFITQYPKLQNFVIEDIEELRENDIVKHLQNNSKNDDLKKSVIATTIYKPPQMEVIHQYLAQKEIASEIVEFMNNLVDYIHSKKEFGATARELKINFGNNENVDLPKLLSFLCNNYVLLRTGVTHIIYVHYEFQASWLTEACLLTPEEEEMFKSSEKDEMKKLKTCIVERLKTADPHRVQLKPWTKLDGTLNENMFNEWLCIILSHCLDCPCIPFTTLCQQFSYLKPVDIFSLLEILRELCCVEICLFSKNHENGLFSPRVVIDDDVATCLDDFQDIYVKTCNVSGLCFGSYLDKDNLFDCI